MENQNFVNILPTLLTFEERQKLANEINNVEDLAIFQARLQVYIYKLIHLFRKYYPSSKRIFSQLWGGGSNIIPYNEQKDAGDKENIIIWTTLFNNLLYKIQIIEAKSLEFGATHHQYFAKETTILIERYCMEILRTGFDENN